MKYAATLALAAITLSSCASGPEDALRGSWEARGGEMVLRFAADGSFTASAPRGETTGHYRYVEDGKLQMEFDGISELFGVSVSEGVLTFCQENHGCQRFRESD